MNPAHPYHLAYDGFKARVHAFYERVKDKYLEVRAASAMGKGISPEHALLAVTLASGTVSFRPEDESVFGHGITAPHLLDGMKQKDLVEIVRNAEVARSKKLAAAERVYFRRAASNIRHGIYGLDGYNGTDTEEMPNAESIATKRTLLSRLKPARKNA